MKKQISTLIGTLFILGSLTELSAKGASPVQVIWENSAAYTDVRAGRENQRAFEKRVFKQLGEYIEQEAGKILKQGEQLKVVIHDLNLAGDVEMNALGPGENTRVIRDFEGVMMDIEFELLDAGGTKLKASRKKMTESPLSQLSASSKKNEGFYYEKLLLKKWLDKEVRPL